MGKISIEESGMKFREYDERDVFTLKQANNILKH